MRVAVSGGTGFVGGHLVRRLLDDGNAVTLLARDEDAAMRQYGGRSGGDRVDALRFDAASSSSAPDPRLVETLSSCDAVVNLAGEPLSEGRWTPAVKEAILNSRVVGSHKLVRAIQSITTVERKPRVLVSTSAVGYYGTSERAEFDESSPPGNQDFLSEVAQQWEGAVQGAGVRTVVFRFGIVLGKGGGVLRKIMPLYSLFVGGPIGSGRQWVSWVHVDDVVGLIVSALGDSRFEGAFNATAPNPVQFREFASTLGSVMRRPNWLPVPAAAVQALLGEAAQTVIKGQRVLPKRTQAIGYDFRFTTVGEALSDVAA